MTLGAEGQIAVSVLQLARVLDLDIEKGLAYQVAEVLVAMDAARQEIHPNERLISVVREFRLLHYGCEFEWTLRPYHYLRVEVSSGGCLSYIVEKRRDGRVQVVTSGDDVSITGLLGAFKSLIYRGDAISEHLDLGALAECG